VLCYVASGHALVSVQPQNFLNIFINDPEENIRSQVLKFADDTKIFRRVGDSLDSDDMQQDLDTLVEWADRWQMEFNVGKCKVMHVGKKNVKFPYHMRGNVLKEVELEKDLGVFISVDLKCSQQCVYACNKANKVMGMIRRTISYKEPRIMLGLFKTLVRPHIEYCSSAWNPFYKKDKELIEKVQHRFTKMILNMKGKSYEERITCLGLWTLEERRNRQDLIEVFKMFKGISRVSAQTLFTVDDNKKGTRGHHLKLIKARCTGEIARHFFSNRVVNRWNLLDQEAVDAPSINSFKAKLTKIRHNRMGFFMD